MDVENLSGLQVDHVDPSGAHLLAAVATSCTTAKLFTSTNVSNHPMQQLLQSAGWRPVGLLHGLDEGDPELFHLCPSMRLRDATGTER
jgi:hypothetical protein